MENKTKLMSVRDAIIMAMSEEMRRDENVFLMGEDVGIFGGDFGTSVGMLEEFGKERVRDTPISENAISGAAIGAAMTGMRPIVDVTFMDFIVRNNIVIAAKQIYVWRERTDSVVFRAAVMCRPLLRTTLSIL
jgi:pyruvate dehydrogenase E1 component beta subunit